MVLTSAVVIVSFSITFYRTSAFQKDLVLDQAARQARTIHKQILLTRRWVSDHNGLFFLKTDNVKANPFLNDKEILDVDGRHYVKRNPAMVTRELSEYANREGLFYYRVTTLQPINPANAPDEFERKSLELFEQGVKEVIEIHTDSTGKTLHYIAPLIVEDSCKECHHEKDYVTGDTRGGLSIAIPINWAFNNIAKNNRMLLGIWFITILVVGFTIFMMIDILVVRRLATLAKAMDRLPEDDTQINNLPVNDDEVGKLSLKLKELYRRLLTSQQELDRSREQVFQGEKLAALGRLTAGIAHEINNPLGGMLNCIKSMQESPDDRELNQRYQELLSKGLKRIGDTVRQLLNFGRREPLKLRSVQVDDLIRECFTLLEYGLKNIELTLDLNLNRPFNVDVESLKQVIVNIGLNSIQAMGNGGKLTVESRETDTGLLIKIIDTGIGMDEDQVQKIFDPFFTTKDVGEGTGLGLFVSYSLVQNMNGTITVESQVGHGTCFQLELPVNKNGNTQLDL
ncbi:ATP-binding protein [Thermodesulfobacteriota bacterium]